jgi:uncharacterized membrane protein YdbT with pleckstrin-like domain
MDTEKLQIAKGVCNRKDKTVSKKALKTVDVIGDFI